jgi:hypothetical protein
MHSVTPSSSSDVQDARLVTTFAELVVNTRGIAAEDWLDALRL